MLMTYLKLDNTTRLMQERGERLFRVRCESYRDNQKNISDRLLHAFPAMITTRWADANDYSSDRRSDRDESKMCETKRTLTITFGNGFQIFVPFPPCFLFPPFVPLFPLQPLLPPIIPLTSSVLPLSLPVCLARPRALYAQARALTEPCVPR